MLPTICYPKVQDRKPNQFHFTITFIGHLEIKITFLLSCFRYKSLKSLRTSLLVAFFLSNKMMEIVLQYITRYLILENDIAKISAFAITITITIYIINKQ